VSRANANSRPNATMTPETNWTSGNGQRPRLKEGSAGNATTSGLLPASVHCRLR
jgi:hypothetical protein